MLMFACAQIKCRINVRRTCTGLLAPQPRWGRKEEDGCSPANALAAGIAALILSIARLAPVTNENDPRVKILGRLWTRVGMRQMLKSISVPKDHEKMRYIDPMRLVSASQSKRLDILYKAAHNDL